MTTQDASGRPEDESDGASFREWGAEPDPVAPGAKVPEGEEGVADDERPDPTAGVQEEGQGEPYDGER